MQRLLVKLYVIPFISVIMVIGIHTEASGQRSTNRDLNLGAMRSSKLICEDSLRMFQIRYPFLSSLPPLLTSMPLDVLIGYIAADSALRHGQSQDLNARVLAWHSFNDTLRLLGKYLYKMVDWDPVRYRQYTREIELSHKGVSSDTLVHRDAAGNRIDSLPAGDPRRYQVILRSLESEIVRKYCKQWSVVGERKAVSALLNSDHILRVRALSVDSTRNYYNDDASAKRYAVTAEVLDVIKGIKYLDVCSDTVGGYLTPWQSGMFSPSANSVVSSNPCPRIRFEYHPGIYWSGPWNVSPPVQFNRDTTFITSVGEFTVQPNAEFVVFLSYRNPLLDDSFDYYNLDVATTASWGVLRIEDGMVSDLNNVWGATNVPYATFKSVATGLIQRICNP